VAPDRHRIVNGSGLSRDAFLAPSALDAVLRDMHNNLDLGPEFRSTLAVGGRDGTLWHRFREDGMEGRVRAKTGSLSGVVCLAGYVAAADGTDYAFTFFVNDLDGSTARARAAHDQLVRVLSGVTGSLAAADDGGSD
jgi:D-alanyl-D-alanine carboxypeptidase/D-alanyl-D-alanine-endopeptidase (penicillin-binding protein 4)